MRSIFIYFLFLIGVATLYDSAWAQPSTTAHLVLDLEAEIFPGLASRRQLLDGVIADARRTIRLPNGGGSAAAARAEAVRTMEAIDALLIAHNFIYPGDGLVQHLSQALNPQRLTEENYEDAVANHHNTRRADAMAENMGGDFYIADCDLASFVYLAIGESIGLPIEFVEVPGHNFVRWRLPDGAHINFETMDGVEQTDHYYRAAYGVNPADIRPGRHLVALTRDEILGYVQRLRGVWWKQRGQWQKARRDYLRASQLRPTDPAGHNSLAWLLATCPEAACRDGRLAVESAKVAVSLERSADYVDTLACAYAAAGDFRTAERHSLEAVAMSGSESLRANLEAIRAAQLCPADEQLPSLVAMSAQESADELLEPSELGNH